MDGEMSIVDWGRIALEAGLDAIDLSIILIKEESPDYLEETRQELAGLGIGVTMVTTYPDFTHPDAARRTRELAKSKEEIRVAARLGAELVRVTAGQAQTQYRAGGWHRLGGARAFPGLRIRQRQGPDARL
jgi:sugar phosphate isomerase/epimerase